MKSKIIIEIILFAMITVMLVVLGLFLPFLGIIAPVPLIILAVRRESKFTIIASILAAFILFILVDPVVSLVFILTIGFMGVVMGAAFEEKFSSKIIIVIGIITSFISILLILSVLTYILNIDIFAELKGILKLSSDLYQEFGLSEEGFFNINQVINQTINFLKDTYLAFSFCIAIINSLFNYYFSSLTLKKLGYDYKVEFSFRAIRFSRILSIIYILSIIFFNNILVKNICVIITFLLFMEGLSVLYYYFLKFRNQRLIALILLTIFFFMPMINYLSLLIGFLDIWIDFRKLHKS
ncbi:uncharacterized protein YybS (DUF2232 family) [Orenia metallireducens]|uniref:Uncharacterized conserved protein YybS, DUF2232 family n=1 Tax=Orenia metallireducens TaxID=1413210 RepID=A0A285G399_9FIRM|nr:DUF2232 domain-containing protein [Orenia metallireducens]PRX31829.1 uncharacterized protein YybS (DUF2232 family) [Orenia metallireducens]SNY17564.1 Uncharacterized conserved protein YybS, DUF2232 family [Orenia metallireducens]